MLPTGPSWVCELVKVVGDRLAEDGKPMLEEVELWRRDPLEIIQDLISNPMFKDEIVYQPERVYKDEEGKIRVYDEMWTGDWWWDTQVRKPTYHELLVGLT